MLPRVLLATAFAALAVSAQSPYQRWLDEEVRWIVTEDERSAFDRLQTDDDRMRFIESFWVRRDPTPGTPQNEFREEHYRRIAWANDRYGSTAVPGWKTDRGMVYVRFGAPDQLIDATSPTRTQRWIYRNIEGIGQSVVLEFSDSAGTNEYRLTSDPSLKDRLIEVPWGIKVR